MSQPDMRKGMPPAVWSAGLSSKGSSPPSWIRPSRRCSANCRPSPTRRGMPIRQQQGADHAQGRRRLRRSRLRIAIDWLTAREASTTRSDVMTTRQALRASSSSTARPAPSTPVPAKCRRPGAWSKSRARPSGALGFEVDILDLSRTASEFGKTIHPCKSCVSTAMPLCHWPCSCYPNYSLGQAHDWMNEIYPLWVAAHGILIVTPVNWYQVPGPLKAMIDRLVCADGGNPDPTSTHGKDAAEAKALELEGWSYPRHLAGRHFAVVVHGDTVGAESLRRALSDWATDMQLISPARSRSRRLHRLLRALRHQP